MLMQISRTPVPSQGNRKAYHIIKAYNNSCLSSAKGGGKSGGPEGGQQSTIDLL